VLQKRRFALALETLERRDVPAGNVLGVVQSGSLILTGDDLANEIEIRILDDKVRILGQNGTTVNGAASEVFGGVFKDVVMKLKGGDDILDFDNQAVVNRDLVFYGQSGADSVTTEPGVRIGRDFIVIGGGGTTDIDLTGMNIGRNAVFSGKADVLVDSANGTVVGGLLSISSPTLAGATLDDTVLGRLKLVGDDQAGAVLTDVVVGGKASIKGGPGDDLLIMDAGCGILGDLVVKLRGGDDTVGANGRVFGNATINLGGGSISTVATADLTVFGDLTIISEGSAADTWSFQGADVLGRTTLMSDKGADTVLFDDSNFYGRFDFLSGGGSDQVQIGDDLDVAFRAKTLIDLGNGADTLQLGVAAVGQAQFRAKTILQGGNGVDTLSDLNSVFDVGADILSF
jgi:hypothetical protein